MNKELSARLERSHARGVQALWVWSKRALWWLLEPFRAFYLGQRIILSEDLTQAVHGKTCSHSVSANLIINPRGGFRLCLDTLVAISVVLTCIFEPFRAAFNIRLTRSVLGIETTLDVVFLMELLSNFRTAHFVNGSFVTDARYIVRRYLSSWFLVDALSLFPFEALSNHQFQGSWPALIRTLRILKLNKMLRATKFVVITMRWRRHLPNEHRMKVISFLSVAFLVVHWVACAWFGASTFYDHNQSTWVYTYFHREDRMVSSDPAEWLHGETVEDFTKRINWYFVAFYFSLSTVTTVGYGDITPCNDLERGLASFCQMIGGIFYAYVISSVANLAQATDPFEAILRDQLQVVDGILALRNVSPLLRSRIRDYYQRFMAGVNLESKEEEFLGKLSLPLATDSSVLMTRHVFKMCHHLQAIDEAFIAQHDIQLEHVQFAEGEDVVTEGEDTNDIYILALGAVTVHEWNGDVVTTLRSGAIFGEMAAILGTNTRQATVRSASVTEVYVIPAELLFLIMRTFPAIESDLVSIVKARHLHLTTGILLPLLPDAELENIFNLADSAVSSRLSHHQLFAVLRMMNRAVTEQQFGRFLEIVDPETTGFVPFREFMKVFGLSEMIFDAWWETDSIDASADRFNFRLAGALTTAEADGEAGFTFEPKPIRAVSATLAAHGAAIAAELAARGAQNASNDRPAEVDVSASFAAPRRGSVIDRRKSLAGEPSTGTILYDTISTGAKDEGAVSTTVKGRREQVEERVLQARARTPPLPSQRDLRPNLRAAPKAQVPAAGSKEAERLSDAMRGLDGPCDEDEQQWQQKIGRQLQPSRLARARAQMTNFSRKLLGSSMNTPSDTLSVGATWSDRDDSEFSELATRLQAEKGVGDRLSDGTTRSVDHASPLYSPPLLRVSGSHTPGPVQGRMGESLDSSALKHKFRDILESGSKLDRSQRLLRNTTEDGRKYESARQIFSEMQKFRQTDIVKKIAFIIQCQQELDAITPELLSQVPGCSLDQVMAQLGEVELMQEIVDATVVRIRQIKSGLLKRTASIAAEEPIPAELSQKLDKQAKDANRTGKRGAS